MLAIVNGLIDFGNQLHAHRSGGMAFGGDGRGLSP
jgi:hypothetical protein